MATREEFVSAMMQYNVLDPVITYEGDYTFQSISNHIYDEKKDILMLNSLVDKNGKNKYKEYMRHYFYDCVNLDHIEDVPKGFLFPLLVSMLSEDGKHRVLRYSYILTLMNLTENKPDLADTMEIEAICEKDREWYKSQRAALKDYKINRLKSEHAYDVLLRFAHSPAFIKRFGLIPDEQIMDNALTIDKFITDDWINQYSERFTNMIITLRHIKDHTLEKHDAPMEAFVNCFDPDVFLLMTMKTIIDNQPSSIRLHGVPDNSLIEVSQYLTTLDRMQVKGYNPTIKVYDQSTKSIKNYTVKDLKNEYNRIYNKHKDKISSFELTSDQIERMGLQHSIEAIDKFRELIKEDEENIIKADWDILSPGEKEPTYTPARRSNNDNSESSKKRIDEDEILYRKYIFQQTDFLKQIVGREKFKGYVGYIYENGLVIFEKFYEEGGKVAQMQATYVMNYKNFLEFTQLTKPEILEYIKNTDNKDVLRLYHTKNWASRLASIISSVDKTMESQVFAETLSSGDVKIRKRSDN